MNSKLLKSKLLRKNIQSQLRQHERLVSPQPSCKICGIEMHRHLKGGWWGWSCENSDCKNFLKHIHPRLFHKDVIKPVAG
jgi:hypothetical protein